MRNTGRYMADNAGPVPHRIPLWERGFGLAVLLMAMGVVDYGLRRRDAGSTASPEGDPAKQLLLLVVYGATLVLIARRWQSVIRVIEADELLWAVVAVALASVVWSSLPDVTLRRSLALLGATLFGAYFAARYKLKEQLGLVGWAMGIVIVLNFLIE